MTQISVDQTVVIEIEQRYCRSEFLNDTVVTSISRVLSLYGTEFGKQVFDNEFFAFFDKFGEVL